MIGIINLGFSNIRSVTNTMKFLNHDYIEISSINDWPDDKNITKIIFPGVGSFIHASQALIDSKLKDNLINFTENNGLYLGICIGMQLLFDFGFEGGKTEGLSIIPGEVKKITPHNLDEKTPHNGWNTVRWIIENSQLRQSLPNESDYYFNHSFAPICDEKYTLATTPYGENKIISAVQKDNIYGVQFHPEKSQRHGIKLIENFIKL